MKRTKYYDVMLKPHVKRSWPKLRRGRYYPTGTRQLPDGRVEVTLHLPPSVLRQWGQAITSGRRIRLFVPR